MVGRMFAITLFKHEHDKKELGAVMERRRRRRRRLRLQAPDTETEFVIFRGILSVLSAFIVKLRHPVVSACTQSESETAHDVDVWLVNKAMLVFSTSWSAWCIIKQQKHHRVD